LKQLACVLSLGRRSNSLHQVGIAALHQLLSQGSRAVASQVRLECPQRKKKKKERKKKEVTNY
jgi:hypothetical protein